MERLRLAVALPHLGVYGGVRRFLELGRIWSERGHDVALATPPDPRAAPWLPFPGRLVPIDALTRERWDALITPDPALFEAIRLDGALRVFYAVLEKAPGAREAWRSADLVLANSRGMARHLRRRGVHAVEAPGGVNLATFHPPKEEARPRSGRSDAPVCALVYGRLSRRRKGSLAAAQAVDRAARRAGVEVTLTLFDSPPPGEPPPPERLPLSIPHRWVIHPSQETLVGLYGEADLFVSAERRAGWCNTAAEAMACGAAVVCTRSGAEDFACHGETALVSRFPWTWTLARHVTALLRDPDRRARIAAGGRRRIQEFPWERTAATIEAALIERLRSAQPGGKR
ncbi:MAG: glycosyltransferase [Bacteroidota bacterium]